MFFLVVEDAEEPAAVPLSAACRCLHRHVCRGREGKDTTGGRTPPHTSEKKEEESAPTLWKKTKQKRKKLGGLRAFQLCRPPNRHGIPCPQIKIKCVPHWQRTARFFDHNYQVYNNWVRKTEAFDQKTKRTKQMANKNEMANKKRKGRSRVCRHRNLFR